MHKARSGLHWKDPLQHIPGTGPECENLRPSLTERKPVRKEGLMMRPALRIEVSDTVSVVFPEASQNHCLLPRSGPRSARVRASQRGPASRGVPS